MDAFTDSMIMVLDRCGDFVEAMLNALSLLFIVLGVVMSFVRSIQQRRRDHTANHPLHTYFRMLLGGWLVVALELQLAADIVSTLVSPSKQHLIELAAIAVIRTFLNYFLNKELLEERELLYKYGQ